LFRIGEFFLVFLHMSDHASFFEMFSYVLFSTLTPSLNKNEFIFLKNFIYYENYSIFSA
jgi:hypothetical protein